MTGGLICTARSSTSNGLRTAVDIAAAFIGGRELLSRPQALEIELPRFLVSMFVPNWLCCD